MATEVASVLQSLMPVSGPCCGGQNNAALSLIEGSVRGPIGGIAGQHRPRCGKLRLADQGARPPVTP